jgi:3-hydroxybutyryl-CoA dehydrogenase
VGRARWASGSNSSGLTGELGDPDAAALDAGAQRIATQLARSAQRGRLTAEAADAAAGRLEPVSSLDALADCELVIEAAPESLAIKHELFGAIAEHVSRDCVLATNTSSLLVTAVAAARTCSWPPSPRRFPTPTGWSACTTSTRRR